MIVITAPDLPWLRKVWQCPSCGGKVEFEISDATGVPPLKPQLISGRWIAVRQCPWCRNVRTFADVTED